MLIVKSPLIAKQYVDEYIRIRSAAFDHKNLPAYDHPACNKRTPANPAAPATRGTLPGAMTPMELIGEADERE